MNLPCKFEAAWQTPAPSDWVEGYVNGHRDTRHAAAELALRSDAINAELLEALQEVTQLLDMVLGVQGGYPPNADGPAVRARAAIKKATA